MRLFLLPLIIFIVVGITEDIFIFRKLSRLTRFKWLKWVHAVFSIAMLAMIVTAISLPRRSGSEEVMLAVMWMLWGYLTVYLPKTIWSALALLSETPRLCHRKPVSWLSVIGIIIAVGLFFAMWWGALINRTEIDIKHVEVTIPDLPNAFDGYKIAQFSDLHTGTFGNDTTFISSLVDSINTLGADMIAFTGDIVNRRTIEIEPFTDILGKLRAPDGVVSILGNHDYGDYSAWSSPETRLANNRQLNAIERGMGWILLNDSTIYVSRGNDSIAVIGVENISQPPFPTYGNLANATVGVPDSITKILLSHNPSHWGTDISNNPDRKIALTLSGHTHAMQLEVGGFSPAKWVYPLWGGLSDDKYGQQLYVNIGAGTVGFPARIGATPEITLITLRKN